MKNLEKPKNKKITTQTAIAILFVIVFMLFEFVLLSMYLSYKPQNIVNIQTNIVSVVENKKSDERITLKDSDGTKYIIYDVVANGMNFDELKQIESHDVILSTITDDGTIEVLGITSSVFNFDFNKGIELEKNDFKSGLIILGSLLIVCIALLVYSIIKNVRTNKKPVYILDKYKMLNFQTPYSKNYFIGIFSFYFLDLIIYFILILLTDNLYMHLCYWGAFVVIMPIFNYIALRIYRNNNFNYYNTAFNFKYKEITEETRNVFFDIGNNITLKFEKDGFKANIEEMTSQRDLAFKLVGEKKIKVEQYQEIQEAIDKAKQLPEILPYAELNLYTKVLFNRYGQMVAFVSSNLDEKNPYGLKNDIVFELNQDSYNFIQNYYIKVDGLEKFMKDKLKLLDMYGKGKGAIIDIHD